MKKIKIPFFFYVNMREESNSTLKKEFVDWMNQARNSGRYLEETIIRVGNYNYVGFRDIAGGYYPNMGAIQSDYEHKLTNNGSEKVTLDFWNEHIRNKEYYAVAGTLGALGSVEVVKLHRNQIVKQLGHNTLINKALRDNSDFIDFVKGKDTFISIKDVMLYSRSGPCLDGGETTEVDGDCISRGAVQYLTATNKIFRCEGTGHYSDFYYKTKVIVGRGFTTIGGATYEEPTEVKLSSYRYGSLYKSNRDDITFWSKDVARDYGYDMCEEMEDWLPKEECKRDPNARYHKLDRRWNCEKGAAFTIGVEIEKEDEEAREIMWDTLFGRNNWIKESDSSLCDESGYELVSPVYDLMSNQMETDIKADPELLTLVNADYSNESCGGHINIGSSIYSPIQLFYGLKGFLPLLYSIYSLRVENDYSEARKPHRYTEQMGCSDHSAAIQIKDNVLELRIVSAVRNLKNLLWRRDLIRIMCKNINKSEQEVLRMMLNPRSILHKHMRKVYTSEPRFMEKCNQFVKFSEEYNDTKLQPIDWSRFDKNKK